MSTSRKLRIPISLPHSSRAALSTTTPRSEGTTTPRSKGTEEDERENVEEDWVETTNEGAMRSLTHWLTENDGAAGEGEGVGEGVRFSTRIDVKGRKVYRFRVGPKPPSPPPPFPIPPTTTTMTTTLPTTPTKPTIAIQSPTPKALRATRSIPLLFGSSSKATILHSNQKSTSKELNLGERREMNLGERREELEMKVEMGERRRGLRRSGSTPGLYATATANSREGLGLGSEREGKEGGNLSAGREGDILGGLIGWYGITSQSKEEEEESESEEKEEISTLPPPPLNLPPARRPSSSSPPTNLPLPLLPIDRPSTRAQSDPALPPSPFGSNVRSPRQRHLFPPSNDGRNLGNDSEAAGGGMVIREVPSSDSMRTERPHHPSPLEMQKNRYEDSRIFDIFQSPDASLLPFSPSPSPSSESVDVEGMKRGGHSRMESSNSIGSSLSDYRDEGSNRMKTREITVYSTPGDDPRFIIWGRQASPTTLVGFPIVSDGVGLVVDGIGGKAGFPLVVDGIKEGRMRRGSFIGGGGGGGGGGSGTSSERASPLTTSSRRWSAKNRRTSESSPATSFRDSLNSSLHSPLPPPSPPTTTAATTTSRILMAATPERWIAELTSSISSALLSTFFLSYRTFITPLSLLSLLTTRFNWSLHAPSSPADEVSRRIVRVRSFLVLRYWLISHFCDDFVPDRELRAGLTGWLNETGRSLKEREKVGEGGEREKVGEGGERDAKLINGLKKLVRRLREGYLQDVRSMEATEEEEEVDLSPSPDGSRNSPPTTTTTNRKSFFLYPASTSTAHLPRQNFPLPDTQNPLSRTLTNALGNFGRFKRMVKSRSSINPHSHPRSSSSRSASVEVEVSMVGEGKDLLYSKDDLENYLDLFQVGMGSGSEMEEGETEDSIEFVNFDAVGFAAEEEKLSRQKSSRTLRSVISRLPFSPSHAPPPSLPSTSTSDDLFQEMYGRQNRPTSQRIELDDIDLSDEDEDVLEVKKSMRRLPGGGTARMLARLRPLSTNSVESRYSFRLYPSAEHEAGREAKRGGIGLEGVSSLCDESVPEGIQVVPHFILEGLCDSDEEEGGEGDVESALRRLEGIIDAGREREKGRRVEVQMERSAKAAAEKERLRVEGMGGEEEALDTTESDESPRLATPESTTTASPLLAIPQPYARLPTLPRTLTPTHRSHLLSIRTEILAQQFTLIERDLFRVLTWQEIVSFSWLDRSTEEAVMDWEVYLKERRRADLARGGGGGEDVRGVVGRFNLTVAWVVSEIVLTVDLDERASLIAKFIRLAFKCYRLNNFHTVVQIIQGLQHPSVDRLHKTLAKVPSWEMHVYKRLIIFISSSNNFKYLRNVMESLVEESAFGASTTSLKGNSVACIPFIGIFLKDLNTISSLPTYLDPTSPHSPAVVDSIGLLERVVDPGAFEGMGGLPSGVGLYPLINVHKFRLLSQVISQINAFQEIAESYSFLPESANYFKCLKLRALSPSTLAAFSARLE